MNSLSGVTFLSAALKKNRTAKVRSGSEVMSARIDVQEAEKWGWGRVNSCRINRDK